MATEKQTDSPRGGSSNLSNDPHRASEAGKKGGEHSHSGSQKSGGASSQNESGGSRGGSGNFSSDHQKASDAGKKGGEHSHGGK